MAQLGRPRSALLRGGEELTEGLLSSMSSQAGTGLPVRYRSHRLLAVVFTPCPRYNRESRRRLAGPAPRAFPQMDLDTPITYLKGVGPHRAKMLEAKSMSRIS